MSYGKFLSIILCFLSLPLVGFAMQSGNYKINIDALDVGGIFSSSPNYLNEDTVGETGAGVGSSTSYVMEAGYQQMFQTYLSLSSQGNISMPSIGGITGGVSTSSLSWTVTTDDAAGYGLYIQASSSPALRASSGASFADYTPSGSAPDLTWSILSSASAFGFTPQGSDIIARYKDNGSVCNSGSSDTAYACWDGLSTTQKLISQSVASNQPSGTQTSVILQAQIGSAKIQDSGAYQATITVTAVAL
ncbi:MAG: hypothetical protein WCQ60_00185 [bacterium]